MLHSTEREILVRGHLDFVKYIEVPRSSRFKFGRSEAEKQHHEIAKILLIPTSVDSFDDTISLVN